MIGQLINDFDSLNKPNLADFNRLFNLNIEGNPSQLVRIGDMVVGGLREIFIGNNNKLIELVEYPKKEEAIIEKPKRKGNYKGKTSKFIFIAIKGVETVFFKTKKEMAVFLKRSPSSIEQRFLHGYSKNVDGWIISRVLKKDLTLLQ